MSDKEEILRLKDEVVRRIKELEGDEFLDFVWGLRNIMSDFESEDETEEDKKHRYKIIQTCNNILNNE